ncbi:FAD-binding oxidoreductase [Niveibacterium sp. SC-1]|uniref:FAD-binding oxidoreductase n=1 Tax=Niveibacterium sp. SC-1 TaxID=3135646 RepID=UPI00312027EE
MTEILSRLADIVGAPNLLTAQPDVAPYLRDQRGRYEGRALAVVRPANTEELAAVMQACYAAGVPMVPQGGNTGLCGGATPDDSGSAVVITTGRMRKVRAVDTANDTITVEAGCTLAELQAAAEKAGRLFPLSLASEGSCQIGGNLSTNAGGVHVLRYGNARELVLGLEVVLPDGRIWNGLRGLRKDNTGYDLKQLFVGGEGTLGIIAAAVLKLFPLPATRAVAWVAVPSAEAAVRLLGRVKGGAGERLVAFELISRATLDVVLNHIAGAQDPLPQPSPWVVLFELADSDAQADLNGLIEKVLEPALEAEEALDAAIAHSEAQIEALWALRENASEAQKRQGVSIKHDVSVPVSRIPEFLARADAGLQEAFPGIRIVAFGHVGDGNLHYNCSMADPVANKALVARTEEVNRVVHDVVASLDGSISAEHGLGQLKREEITRYKAPLELELMRGIKQAFDPRGLMNPGKVL